MRMCVLATAAATRYGNGSTSMAPGALLSGARGPCGPPLCGTGAAPSLSETWSPRSACVGGGCVSLGLSESLDGVCFPAVRSRLRFPVWSELSRFEACCFKPGNRQLSNKMCLCTTCEEPAQLSSPALAELATVRSTHDGGPTRGRGPTGAVLGRIGSRFGRGAGHGAWAAPSR